MLRLRPHHILDIVRNIGHERKIEPHPFGHDLHVVTNKIIEDIDAIEKSISEKFPQFTTIFVEPANKFVDF